jgi:hypothetical protein
MSEQTLAERLNGRANGLCLYGIAPPRHSVSSDELRAIAMQQSERIRALGADGLIVYDIQDESDRTSAARPFPFLPTVDAGSYAFEQLRALEAPRIVYRNVSRDTPESFVRWLSSAMQRTASPVSVLVGAASRNSRPLLTLSQAYALRAQHAPNLLVGGVSIAERHARGADEHQRMLAKIESGCRFFVTQAVYDVNLGEIAAVRLRTGVRRTRHGAGPGACDLRTLWFCQNTGLHAVVGNLLPALARK